MDTTELIQSLGLSRIETNIYLTLLTQGELSMSNLARKSLIKRSTAYIAVDSLLVRGLVFEIIRGKRKEYGAQHPNRLLEIARYREKLISKTLPQLIALQKTNDEKPRVIAIEGKKGITNLYNELYDSLAKKEEAIFITRVSALSSELVSDYRSMHQRLKNPKVRELVSGEKAGKAWIKDMAFFTKNNPNHIIKLLDEKFAFGLTDILLLENKIAIFTFGKTPIATVIESKEAAKTIKALFEVVWNTL